MKSRYDAIHFDMDGVIVDTEFYHVVAEQQACIDYGFAIDPAEWGGFKGRTAEDIFSHLIVAYGDVTIHSAAELIEHKTDVFLESISENLVAIDGVLSFLQWARQAHKKMALVTSSNRRIQSHITEALGISDLFDSIVTGDDVTEGKPSPMPYLLSIGRLGIRGDASVVIEDSMSGIASAKSADCDVLAVTTSHTSAELKSSRPTYIADSYESARKKLEI